MGFTSFLTFVRGWLHMNSQDSPKLSIELVPSTAWGANVRAVLTPSAWDIIRREVYQAANHRCEICGGVGKAHPLEAHEVWEYNDQLHVQRLVRMIGLCPACHSVKHFGLAMIRGQTMKALNHLAHVNGWTLSKAQAYVKQSFKTHEERSRHVWLLDITALKPYGVAIKVKPIPG